MAYRAVWPNQPERIRVRAFRSRAALEAYVSEVLAVAARCHINLRATWTHADEVRIVRSR